MHVVWGYIVNRCVAIMSKKKGEEEEEEEEEKEEEEEEVHNVRG